MAAVPARATLNFVVQDDRGFKARVTMVTHVDDLLGSTTVLGVYATDVAAVGTALAAMTNAKVVSSGLGFDFDIAQEPSTETGTYQLVNQGLHLTFGDGAGLKEFLTVPAPKDNLFLTSASENLIVANPSASGITGLQSAMSNFNTPGDGVWGAQFFGGQLRSQKPRRRRVLQGA